MQTTSVKERNYLFDNMKVVLVFFMVSAHYIRISGSFDVSSFGGFFYIIAFSFTAGISLCFRIFFQECGQVPSGSRKNFLLPYVAADAADVRGATGGIRGSAEFDLLSPSHALWFLLVLFVYRFMIKDLAKVPGVLLLMLHFCWLPAVFLLWERSWRWAGSVPSVLFFMLGYKMEWKHIEKIRSISKKWILLLLAGLLVFSFLTAYTNVIPVEMWHLKDGYSIYHLSDAMGMVIRALLGIVSLGWRVILINLLPNRKLFCTGIGQRTMTVYICQHPDPVPHREDRSAGRRECVMYILSFGLAVASIYLFSRPALHTAYHAIIDFLYDKICARVLHLGNVICTRTVQVWGIEWPVKYIEIDKGGRRSWV